MLSSKESYMFLRVYLYNVFLTSRYLSSGLSSDDISERIDLVIQGLPTSIHSWGYRRIINEIINELFYQYINLISSVKIIEIKGD